MFVGKRLTPKAIIKHRRVNLLVRRPPERRASVTAKVSSRCYVTGCGVRDKENYKEKSRLKFELPRVHNGARG